MNIQDLPRYEKMVVNRFINKFNKNIDNLVSEGFLTWKKGFSNIIDKNYGKPNKRSLLCSTIHYDLNYDYLRDLRLPGIDPQIIFDKIYEKIVKFVKNLPFSVITYNFHPTLGASPGDLEIYTDIIVNGNV